LFVQPGKPSLAAQFILEGASSMKMKVLALLSGVVSLGAVGTALAADMPVKARPAPPVAEVWSWSGFYIGLNAGGAWTDNRRDYAIGLPAGSAAPVFANCASPIGVVPLVIGAGANPFDLSASCGSDSSFIGGGQIGYNWQAGSWVFGLEADGAWQRLIERSFTRFATNGNPTQPFATITGDTAYFKQETTGLGTFRGRVGYAGGPWLLYATGGAAVANVKHTFTEVLSPGNVCAAVGPGTACRSVSNDDTKWGWTIGAGFEWMFARNWSVGAEYLFVDLGKTTLTVLPNGNRFFPVSSSATFEDRQHVARVKLNYHFGGPVIAKY
jgi:outer membrane immunogenic protein